ncbi:MAG TPA: DNA mismatch repair protein MutS, partial [Paralcaligenes sp.]
QVAQRAGIPPAVIRQASRELSRLEAQGAPTPQLDLFSSVAGDLPDEPAANDPDPATGPAGLTLKARLAAIEPDQLTPREALDILYHLRADFP